MAKSVIMSSPEIRAIDKVAAKENRVLYLNAGIFFAGKAAGVGLAVAGMPWLGLLSWWGGMAASSVFSPDQAAIAQLEQNKADIIRRKLNAMDDEARISSGKLQEFRAEMEILTKPQKRSKRVIEGVAFAAVISGLTVLAVNPFGLGALLFAGSSFATAGIFMAAKNDKLDTPPFKAIDQAADKLEKGLKQNVYAAPLLPEVPGPGPSAALAPHPD